MNGSMIAARCGRLLFAALVTWAASAQARSFDTPPQPAAPRPLSIAAPAEMRLPNGLRIVLAERRGVQLVTARLVLLAGAEADPPRLAGLASLTAALLTKGTQRHSASALAQAAESLGGALESGAGWHQSDVGITVTPPRLDEALGLVAETVQQPRFAPAELDRLRTQVLDELKLAYAEPGTLATLAAQHLLYGSGAYGHPAGGTPASLQRIRRADLLALHAAQYRPDQAVLVLAGDIDAETALRLAQRHFGTWRPAAAATASASPQQSAGSALTQTTAVIDMPQSGQAAVVLAVPLPPLGADRAAAAVMNSVLGGGFSSRLNQQIRIQRGLSYGAFSQLDSRRDGGALRLVVQTKNESAAEVAGLLQAELDQLVATPIGDDELAARKATLIGSFSRSVETTAGLAAAVKALIVAGVPTAELRTRIAALTAVSAAEVQRYAAGRLGGAGRRLVIAGEAARFGEALKAAAPALVVVPSAALDLERADGLARP
jgi:zinc protease